MSSRSRLWKKKRNSVFPATESQSKTEAWIQAVIPSSSQVTEESLRSDADPKSQTTFISSVPLPGSVTDYQDKVEAHPSYVVKSIAADEEAGHGETRQEQSLLNKLGFNKNKLSFVKRLSEWKSNKGTAQKGHPSSSRMFFHDNQLGGCLSKEEQPYIPYRFAKLYIAKIAKDMQQMKIGYMKLIKELEHVGKESQEKAIMALKNQHGNKMKILRSQLEAYQELIYRKNQYWQDTLKNLKEENKKLSQEKEELVHQLTLQKKEWDKEKACLLESTTLKLGCLYTQHTLTVEELQKSRLSLEKVQEIVNFQTDLPCDPQRTLIISEEITGNRATDKSASEKKSNVSAQDSSTTESVQSSCVVEMEEGHDCSPQKKLLLEVKNTLEIVKASLLKREKEISELLQNEQYDSQISNTTLTKSADKIAKETKEQKEVYQLQRENPVV